MNDQQSIRDRLPHVSPLILRLGLAAVLLMHGLGQLQGAGSGVEEEQAIVDADGVDVSAGWGALRGVGEISLAGLLGVGFLTRLTSLGLLAAVGLWANTAILGGDAGVLRILEIDQGGSNGLMLLLAAAGLSLLVSGSGCLGLDRRVFGRKRKTETATT